MADTPEKAKEAKEAGKAAAGEAVELKANPGKPGHYSLDSVLVKGGGAEGDVGEEEKTYGISVELQDDQGKPVFALPSGDPVKFRVKSGGQTYEGELAKVVEAGNEKSKATVTGLPEQTCEISFPEIHKDEWKKK